ncbi:hypothetical protein [Paracnuella aquatica]|nr:hypothetical protein [Paracnuella aquatica]
MLLALACIFCMPYFRPPQVHQQFYASTNLPSTVLIGQPGIMDVKTR